MISLASRQDVCDPLALLCSCSTRDLSTFHASIDQVTVLQNTMITENGRASLCPSDLRYRRLLRMARMVMDSRRCMPTSLITFSRTCIN
jgi:hypothetical protein